MARNSSKTVLFLCTGNYYRSRFAEILFNATAKRMGLPWVAHSRALALERGSGNVGPIAKSVLKWLETKGIRDIVSTCRLPQSVVERDFEAAEIVIALHQIEHQPLIEGRFPTTLNQVEFWNIDDDPRALDRIEAGVNSLIARLISGRDSSERNVPATVPIPKQLEKPKLTPKPVTVRVGRETKGRRGKGVTLIWDLPGTEETIRDLATTLKQRCGTGGTVKDRQIEIQGDQRDRITAVLIEMGYLVKRVGG
jgi:predicted translation initiation factor SUI1